VKDLVLIVISSLFFSLSVMANPALISNDKDAITQKEATKHKENNPTAKKKIDITVEKMTVEKANYTKNKNKSHHDWLKKQFTVNPVEIGTRDTVDKNHELVKWLYKPHRDEEFFRKLNDTRELHEKLRTLNLNK